MTRAISDLPVAKLAEDFLKFQELQRQAIARDDVPAANRYFDKLKPIGDALAASDEGREKLVQFLGDSRPYLRLKAAKWVEKWAPELAVPVFGRLLVEKFDDDVTVDERIEMRYSSRISLYLHFGIKNFDRNELIEPLRAYGIEIPRRHRA